MTPLFAFFSPSTMIVLAIIAVLLFGRNLWEIARELGKRLTEFMKGTHGLDGPYTLSEWTRLAALALAIAIGLLVFLVLSGLWRP